MKALRRLTLILVVTVVLAGCVSTTSYEGTLDLNTFPAKSAQVTKADIHLAIAKQRAEIAQNPNSDTHFARLAYLLIKNQQYDESVTAAKMSIQLNPSNDAAYHNLGYAYYSQKQYDRALSTYQKAIEIAHLAVTYNRIGALYMDKMDYPKAAQAYSKASEIDTKNDSHLIMLAVAYYHMGRYDDALSTINKAIDLKNYGTMGMRLKAEKTYDFIRYRTITVTDVEEGGPADKAGIKAGSTIDFYGININDFTISLAQIRQYIEGKAPGTPIEVSELVPGLMTLPHKKTLILERFKSPNIPLELGIKANILAMIGKEDEAIKCATESLDSKQSDNISEIWAKSALGRIYISRGNYDEAIELLCSVKGSSTARVLLESMAYAKQGKMKEALDTYREISEEDISPENVPLWNDRKVLLQMLKPIAQAHRENAKKFEAQGRFQEALDELAGVLTLAMDDKEAGEVRNSIFQMVRRMPQPPEMSEDVRKRVLRGEILVKEGDLEGAISEFKKAVRLAPFSARLYFNTALIYGELENYPEAIRYIKIYLQAAPDTPDARAAKDEIIKWELLMERGE